LLKIVLVLKYVQFLVVCWCLIVKDTSFWSYTEPSPSVSLPSVLTGQVWLIEYIFNVYWMIFSNSFVLSFSLKIEMVSNFFYRVHNFWQYLDVLKSFQIPWYLIWNYWRRKTEQLPSHQKWFRPTKTKTLNWKSEEMSVTELLKTHNLKTKRKKGNIRVS